MLSYLVKIFSASEENSNVKILSDVTIILESDEVDAGPKKNLYADDEFEHINALRSAQNRKKQKPCKKHCCYFCGALLTNLRKHWRRKHMGETLFQRSLEESSKYCVLDRNFVQVHFINEKE